jgi:oxygen-independent coproporphyrinogen-3 oxidase
LPPLIDEGLAGMDGTRLVITERGRPLVRSVCAAFDRYYTGDEGRHARGV